MVARGTSLCTPSTCSELPTKPQTNSVKLKQIVSLTCSRKLLPSRRSDDRQSSSPYTPALFHTQVCLRLEPVCLESTRRHAMRFALFSEQKMRSTHDYFHGFPLIFHWRQPGNRGGSGGCKRRTSRSSRNRLQIQALAEKGKRTSSIMIPFWCLKSSDLFKQMPEAKGALHLEDGSHEFLLVFLWFSWIFHGSPIVFRLLSPILDG